MENVIFKLESTLEKFISTNNSSNKSRGENDRRYLTDNTLEFQIVLSTSPLPNFRKLVTNQALSVLLGTQILVLVPWPQKESPASRTVIQ